MKQALTLFLLFACSSLYAVVYPDDFKDGWGKYVGKTITFNQRMYLCSRHYSRPDRMYISHKRIQCEEECGDDETGCLIYMTNSNTTDFKVPAGAYVDNLTAYVYSANNISVSGNIQWQDNDRETPPDVGGRLKVVTTNLQKYFYNWQKSSFADCTSEQEFTVQTTKIASALLLMDADVFALQEIEETPYAISYLTDLMNTEYGEDVYAYVSDSWNNVNYGKSAFIYRKDRLLTIGGNESGTASNDNIYVYRMRIQCFQERLTGERFVLSVNHFKAKDNTDAKDEETRMQNARNLVTRLKSKNYGDADILIVGDLNNYSSEAPCQYLVSNGYIDQTKKYAPDGYSYLYNNTVGYLDHALANKSMDEQISGVAPFHTNTDFSKNMYGHKMLDTSIHRYSDHDPILIGINLYVKGDANCDGMVDVSDITAIADNILSGNSEHFSLKNADADNDGVITVADITTVASIILE